MKVTPFGEAARILRIKYDLTLKSMAESMGISSAYLSSIEFGEKRLSEKHLRAAMEFFIDKATAEQLLDLRDAGERSIDVLNTSGLAPDARGLVAAFARRLAEGSAPTPEIEHWLKSHSSKG